MRAAIVAIILSCVGAGCAVYHWLGQSALAAWGSYVTGWGTMILGLAALYAGVQAVREYRARARLERGRWMTELFHKFYEGKGGYRLIRQKIDYDDLQDVFALIRKDVSGDTFSQEEKDLFDQFTDYLNFFEYVAYLVGEEQLKASSDVGTMFQYYLTRMARIKESNRLSEYIKDNGFERLQKLLLQYK